MRQWLRWLTAPEITQRPASASEAFKGLRTLQDNGFLSELSLQHSLGRILVIQQESALDIIVQPKVMQPKQDIPSRHWLSLLVMVATLTIAFFIGVEIFGLISFIILVSNGLLLPQLHLRIDDYDLTIYRESMYWSRFRRVLFKAKREEIERLVWGEDQNTLEIYEYLSLSGYSLNRHKLGLTMTEFKKLAQQLRDELGIPLTSGTSRS